MDNFNNQDFTSSSQNWDWTLIFQTLHYKDSPRSVSTKHHTTFRLRLQCLNKILPTFNRLSMIQPHLYRSFDKCILCDTTSETWSHIWLCPSHGSSFNNLIESFLSDLSSDFDKEFLTWNSTLSVLTNSHLFDDFIPLLSFRFPSLLHNVLTSNGILHNRIS